MKSSPLLLRVRRELQRVADPRKAPAMQKYMKSIMPYWGVQASLFEKTCKQLFQDIDLPSAGVWRDDVLGLWRGAKYREERYAAILLSGDQRAAAFQLPTAMPMYEEIIVTGAWWDYVDPIASNRVGPILKTHPGAMKKTMLQWSKCDNLWKRRASILCQLRFKKETDLDLLYRCIEPSIDSTEFFLRKAIGWALRQYAWTDPAEIKRYVRRNVGRLSGLSEREALKRIGSYR